jgi:hypothetical protein
MYNGRRGNHPQAQATAEHRQREDASPRLSAEAPHLATMRLILDEHRPGNVPTGMSYVRLIVVASSPALFAIRCMEPRCDGRHDLTSQIMQAIRQRLPTHTGQSTCNGVINNTLCERTLTYVCEATYRA